MTDSRRPAPHHESSYTSYTSYNAMEAF